LLRNEIGDRRVFKLYGPRLMSRPEKRRATRTISKTRAAKNDALVFEETGSPVVFQGKDLDERRVNGFDLYKAVVSGKTLREPSGDAAARYFSERDKNYSYRVERVIRNRRGARQVEYLCSCPDTKKAGRRDCQHRFAEMLFRGDAVVNGSVRKALKMTAGRRPARKRYSDDGRPIRSSQRDARVKMPDEIPRLVLSLKNAYDARHKDDPFADRNGKLTADSLRAAVLLLKICEGRSADSMISCYKRLIEDGRLPMRVSPHQNSISAWINDATLTPILHEFLAISAEVFRAREVGAIIDSSKVSQLRTAHARLVDYGTDLRPGANWMKAHTLVGVETMAILAVEFTNSNVHDINLLKPLVAKIPKGFSIRFLLGDKAYLSEEILGFLWELGMRAVIPVKSRWDAETKNIYYEAAQNLAEWYDKRPRDFDEFYRLRAKIEGLFSLLKRLAQGFCWSRGRPRLDGEPIVAWQNEVLLKQIFINLRTTVTIGEETGFHDIEHQNHGRFFPPPLKPLLHRPI
jgi:hypothetical protein